MKAVVLVNKTNMEVQEVAKPSPKAGEVLIKVVYTALDTGLHEVANRTMIPGSLLHNLKVTPLVAGWHFSGIVESIAGGADNLIVGDAVHGHLQYSSKTKQGTLSEYITVPASECAKIPEGINMDAAAAVTSEALTALQAMRDKGGLSKGESILIIAAGGGVGAQAVQIAKVLKAGSVHAVCSTKDVSNATKLGADLVIDRTKKDITKALDAASYDVIFDTTGKYSLMKMRYAMKKGGTFVSTIPNITDYPPFSWIVGIATGKHSKSLMVKCNRQDLELVGEWMKSGMTVPIDSVYDIKDIDDARERQESGKKSGRVVIKVADGW